MNGWENSFSFLFNTIFLLWTWDFSLIGPDGLKKTETHLWLDLRKLRIIVLKTEHQNHAVIVSKEAKIDLSRALKFFATVFVCNFSDFCMWSSSLLIFHSIEPFHSYLLHSILPLISTIFFLGLELWKIENPFILFCTYLQDKVRLIKVHHLQGNEFLEACFDTRSWQSKVIVSGLTGWVKF